MTISTIWINSFWTLWISEIKFSNFDVPPIELKNMTKSWKRLKYEDEDDVIDEKDCLGIEQSREDFSSIISSYCQKFWNNGPSKKDDSKNLVRKNSTNDNYDSFLGLIPGNQASDDEDNFEIKSGLGRIRGMMQSTMDNSIYTSLDTPPTYFDAKPSNEKLKYSMITQRVSRKYSTV